MKFCMHRRPSAKGIIASAAALTLFAAACRDELTRPGDPVAGPRAAQDGAPDEYAITLSADEWNGSGRTPQGAVMASFPRSTWVKIEANGQLTRTPNYAGIGGATTYEAPRNTGIAIGPSGIGINANPTYAYVEGNYTLAQRYGYGEREFTGWPTGVYCGRIYGTKCDTWSGSTAVKVTRLAADLQLNAEYTTVEFGATPYFDYRANPMTLENAVGTPFVSDSTHWEPDMPTVIDPAVHAAGIGACQTPYYPACRRQLFGSGTFSISAWVNGKLLRKSIHVSVTTPVLTVSCSPQAVTRGQSVTCTGTLSPAGPFVITKQTSAGDGYSYFESVNASYSSGSAHTWSGPAAIGATVTMLAKIPDGRVIPGRGSFSILPRTWSPWQLTSGPEAIVSRHPSLSPTLRQEGEIVPAGYEMRHFSDSVVPAQRIGSGPNKNAGFVTSLPPLRGSAVYIHPEFLPGSLWYTNQIGPRYGLPTLCTNAQLVTFWEEVRRHEGLTMHPDSSHWGESNQLLASDHPHTRAEAVAVQLSDTSTGVVRFQVANDFWDWLQREHHVVQRTFDYTDYPVIYRKIGKCQFYSK